LATWVVCTWFELGTDVGFLDEVKSLTGTPTLLDIVKKQLSPEEYGEFLVAMRNNSLSCAAIVKVLKARGIETSESAIRRWRKHDDLGE